MSLERVSKMDLNKKTKTTLPWEIRPSRAGEGSANFKPDAMDDPLLASARLSRRALVSTQVPMLPSPPNASEPRRVCVWGRRAGDEGEWRLTDALFICFNRFTFKHIANAAVRYLVTCFLNAVSTGFASLLPLTPVPSPRKMARWGSQFFRARGERLV